MRCCCATPRSAEAGATRPHLPPCQNRPLSLDEKIMDIEQINAIGATLADLSERTTALRGYL